MPAVPESQWIDFQLHPICTLRQSVGRMNIILGYIILSTKETWTTPRGRSLEWPNIHRDRHAIF